MDRTDELIFIRKQIEDNKHILLSCLGLEGIVKSENKERILMDIIRRTQAEYNLKDNEVLNLVFNTLEMLYRSDSVLSSIFPADVRSNFATEEKAYILNNLVKKVG